jgi:hypothetical protein
MVTTFAASVDLRPRLRAEREPDLLRQRRGVQEEGTTTTG